MSHSFNDDAYQKILCESGFQQDEEITLKIESENSSFAVRARNILLFISIVVGLNVALAVYLTVH